MKGMTSACILFTTFIFGGGAYYVLPHLGITRDENSVGTNTASQLDRAKPPMSHVRSKSILTPSSKVTVGTFT
jgi:hypothetical protein